MAGCTGGRPDDWRTATGGGAAGSRLPARDRRQKPGSTFSMLLPTTTRTLNTTCIAQHVTQLETSSSPQGRSRLRDQMCRRKPNASCTREKGRGFKPHGVQRCPSAAIMVWYNITCYYQKFNCLTTSVAVRLASVPLLPKFDLARNSTTIIPLRHKNLGGIT